MRVGTARTEDDDSGNDELTAVQAALAAEHAAVYGYGIVGGRIGGERRKEAQAAYDGHRARRDALHRAVRDLGGKPKASAAAYELPFPVPDAAAAARLAAELEDRLAAVYADLVRAGDTARRGGGGRRTARGGSAVGALARQRRSLPWARRTGSGRPPDRLRERFLQRALNGRPRSPHQERDSSSMATAPIEPPQRLVSSLSGEQDDVARGWLAALPTMVQERLAAWELTLERVHAPGGRSSLLALVRQQDGTPAALKFPVPGRVSAHEAAALTAWDGWGAVRLLRSDEESGALLLERLQGSVSLRSLPEAKALLEAAGTAQRLWVPPGEKHPFETLAGRTEDGGGGTAGGG